MKQKLLGFIVVILALAMGTTSPRTQSRVDVPERVGERAAAGESVPVIVGVNAAFVPEGYLGGVDAVASQRDTIARVLDDVMARAASTGATIGSSYEILPYFTARVDRAQLEALATMPGVVSIAENGLERAHLLSSIPIVNVAPAWAAGHTGAGWTVAIVDTGVEKTHGFLTGKVVTEGCYINAGGAGGGTGTCPGGGFSSVAVGSGAPCSVADDCDHGTHVAGIAAGFNAPGGVNGVAPGASLGAFQVFTRFDDPLDCGGFAPCTGTFPSDQVLALNRIAAIAGPGNVNRIAAVNMSLGGSPIVDQATCNANNVTNGRRAAIQNLRSLGIAVVVSSGNSSNPTMISAPACISESVSVGSVTDALQVSSFSNNASFLSLYAPGSSITSSVIGNAFDTLSGTSMAAPHVAGAWAVLKQAVPGATVPAALGALQSTGTTINDTRSGGTPHPLINVNAARLVLLGATSGGAPGAPTNFAVSGNGNALSMTWTAPVVSDESIAAGAATNYNLIARVSSGGAPVVVLPLGNVTSFGVTAPSGTFFLSVQATNASGSGPESNVVQVTTPVLPSPPGTPSGLVANVTGNSATLNWTAPASGGPVGNYVLVAGQTPGFVTPLATLVLGPAPGTIINGIPPGTWYVRIYANNAGGNSPGTTNEVPLVVAGPQPPGTPTMNTPTVVGHTVGLSWSAGPGGAPTSYTLFASATPGGAPFLSAPLTGTSAGFANVPSGTYYLRLVANNALGSSPPSNQVALVVP